MVGCHSGKQNFLCCALLLANHDRQSQAFLALELTWVACQADQGRWTTVDTTTS